MPKSPQQQIADQQAQEQLDDMQETQEAQDAAATETVPGDQLAAVQPPAPEPVRGNPSLADETPLEEQPELLARVQDPHAANRPEVKTAVFTNSYGGKVRAAV
jgi:hypothetical protein